MVEIEFEVLNKQSFMPQIDEMGQKYKYAFSGYPWHETLSDDTVRRRLEEHAGKDGFWALIIKDESNIVGGIWYNTPTVEQLEEEFREKNGQNLSELAQNLIQQNNIKTLVLLREIFVDPAYQHAFMGRRLLGTFLLSMPHVFKEGSIQLARIRDDNLPMIQIAKDFFQKTDISVPSSQDQNVDHHYWYSISFPFERQDNS